MVDYTLEQVENTIRTYKDALKNNQLTKKEKKICIRKIKSLEKMKTALK